MPAAPQSPEEGGLERAALGEVEGSFGQDHFPFDIAAQMQTPQLGERGGLQFDHIRGDAAGRRGAAPHDERCRLLAVVGEDAHLGRGRGLDDFEARLPHVPGEGHGPEPELRDAVGRRGEHVHVPQADSGHGLLQVRGSLLKFRGKVDQRSVSCWRATKSRASLPLTSERISWISFESWGSVRRVCAYAQAASSRHATRRAAIFSGPSGR